MKIYLSFFSERDLEFTNKKWQNVKSVHLQRNDYWYGIFIVISPNILTVAYEFLLSFRNKLPFSVPYRNEGDINDRSFAARSRS